MSKMVRQWLGSSTWRFGRGRVAPLGSLGGVGSPPEVRVGPGRGREPLLEVREGSGAPQRSERGWEAPPKVRDGSGGPPEVQNGPGGVLLPPRSAGSPPGGPKGVRSLSWRAGSGWVPPLEGREGSGGLTEGSGAVRRPSRGVERPSRLAGKGAQVLLNGRDGLGGPHRVPEGVGRPSRGIGRSSQRVRRP